jgi:hypothetical protein
MRVLAGSTVVEMQMQADIAWQVFRLREMHVQNRGDLGFSGGVLDADNVADDPQQFRQLNENQQSARRDLGVFFLTTSAVAVWLMANIAYLLNMAKSTSRVRLPGSLGSPTSRLNRGSP